LRAREIRVRVAGQLRDDVDVRLLAELLIDSWMETAAQHAHERGRAGAAGLTEKREATLVIPDAVATKQRAALGSAVRDRVQHGHAMRRQLQSERDRMVEQRDQLIELVGNQDWPQDRLEVKMRDLRDRIGGIDEQLARAGTDDVTRAVESLESLMAILENPRALLENAGEERQRSLHSALFSSGKEKNPGPVLPARGSDTTGVAPQLGLEPRTCRLTVGCSAN
jgi:site-specific DNA recombinase